MAATKRKTKSTSRQEKYTAELTSGQLVIGVGILLVFGLACFLLGVLIGKFDPTLQPNMAQSNTPSNQTSAKVETRETKPVTTEPQFVRKDPPPEMRAPAKAIPTPTKETPPAQQAARQVETSTTIPTSARKQQQKDPIAKQDPPPIEEAPKKTTETPVKTASSSIPKEATPAPAKNTLLVTNNWYIQLGAFKLRPNADKERLRLQKKMPYTVSLLSTDDSSYIKIIIGGFNTRNDAEKVKKEISSKYGLSDSIIKQNK